MTRDRHDLVEILSFIETAIERIESTIAGLDEETFSANVDKQESVLLNLIWIGEASHDVTMHYPDAASEELEFVFRQAYRMRNRLTHDYARNRISIVWQTATEDLQGLKLLVIELRSSIE